MKKNCKKTCNFCKGLTDATDVTVLGEAEELLDGKAFAEPKNTTDGHCDDAPGWDKECPILKEHCATMLSMKKNCKKTCNFCKATEATVLGEAEELLDVRAFAPPKNITVGCEDAPGWEKDCPHLIDQCATMLSMKKNCRKTCNICDATNKAPTTGDINKMTKTVEDKSKSVQTALRYNLQTTPQ